LPSPFRSSPPPEGRGSSPKTASSFPECSTWYGARSSPSPLADGFYCHLQRAVPPTDVLLPPPQSSSCRPHISRPSSIRRRLRLFLRPPFAFLGTVPFFGQKLWYPARKRSRPFPTDRRTIVFLAHSFHARPSFFATDPCQGRRHPSRSSLVPAEPRYDPLRRTVFPAICSLSRGNGLFAQRHHHRTDGSGDPKAGGFFLDDSSVVCFLLIPDEQARLLLRKSEKDVPPSSFAFFL